MTCSRGRPGISGLRSGHSCRGCSNRAGASAATCGSISAGPLVMLDGIADTRRNWSRSRRTSSWPMAHPTVAPLLQATRTVPIVFPVVADPVGAGFVDSLARPGGNVTGFMQFEYSLGGKWLELLKEIAPGRDASGGPSGCRPILRDRPVWPPSRPWRRRSGSRCSPLNVRDADEIERAVAAFARAPNGGLIVTASGLAIVHRDLIIALAARHKLPAVYSDASSSTAGGLISYGPDLIDQYRRRPATSTASSRARSRPTCRCRRRPSTSWSSISRPPRRSASMCRRRCSPAPTR